jgi:hypothetical protein
MSRDKTSIAVLIMSKMNSTESRRRHHRLRAYLQPARLGSSFPQEPHRPGTFLSLCLSLSISAAPLPFPFRFLQQQLFYPSLWQQHSNMHAPPAPLQMRPAYHPEGLYDDESKVASQRNAQTITQMWHQNGRCPEGTIPIRRTKEEDVLRASSVRRYGKKKRRSAPNPMSVDPDMLNESGHQVSSEIDIHILVAQLCGCE